MATLNRRPIKTRDASWAQSVARKLTRAGVSPNAVSISGVGFALAGFAAFFWAGRTGGWPSSVGFLLAALSIQGRLLCNLFDGMIAVEGGRQSKSGELFNDFPDRLSDSLLLIGAGYAVQLPGGNVLGWLAALAAVLTAYARLLGGSCGLKQRFSGPMAKQHRMALLTAAAVCSIPEAGFFGPFRGWVLLTALAVIAAGSFFTTARRLRNVFLELESRP